MGSIGNGGELTYLEKGVQDAEKFRKLREKIDESDAAVEEAILQLDIQEGQTILDFGCGEGTLLTRYFIPALATKKDTKLVGLDISESMIEAAKIHNADPRIEYICGDIFSKESSPLAGRKFDKIVSVWVLDYFTDYARVIQELSKYLKPNGLIFILTSAEEKYYNYYEKIRIHPVLSKHLGVPLRPDWVVGEFKAEVGYAKAAAASGLETIDLRTRTFQYTCVNMAECTGFLTSILSAVNNLTPELMEKLKELCAEEVGGTWFSPPIRDYSKPFNWDYKMLTLLARKKTD